MQPPRRDGLEAGLETFIFRTKGLRNATGNSKKYNKKIYKNFHIQNKGIKECNLMRIWMRLQILILFHIQNKGIKECNSNQRHCSLKNRNFHIQNKGIKECNLRFPTIQTFLCPLSYSE